MLPVSDNINKKYLHLVFTTGSHRHQLDSPPAYHVIHHLSNTSVWSYLPRLFSEVCWILPFGPTIIVKKCHDTQYCCLLLVSSLDPFVRVELICSGKRIKKKRTSTKRNTTSPVWNEAIVFNLHGKDCVSSLPSGNGGSRENSACLAGVQLELTVFSDNPLGTNEALGRVTVGDQTTGQSLSHWLELTSSRNAPARWHVMQPVQDGWSTSICDVIIISHSSSAFLLQIGKALSISSMFAWLDLHFRRCIVARSRNLGCPFCRVFKFTRWQSDSAKDSILMCCQCILLQNSTYLLVDQN